MHFLFLRNATTVSLFAEQSINIDFSQCLPVKQIFSHLSIFAMQ